MEGFDEIIGEFLVESYESLDKLDDDLLALEDAPDDRDRLASIFRTIHTIKGASGFLAFPKLERVAHVGENLLVPLRDGALQLSRTIADALLEMVDAIREILREIEQTGKEGEQEYEALVARLKAALTPGDAAEANTQPAPSDGLEKAETLVDELAQLEAPPKTEEAAKPAAKSPRAKKKKASKRTTKTTTTRKKKTTTKAAAPESKPAASESVETDTPAADAAAPEPSEPVAAAPKAPTPAPKPTPANTKPAAASSPSSKRAQSVADSSVRIDVGLLDKLMNLVGELVLARNQIVQFSGQTEDPAMTAASQRLNHITTELQEGVMKTRMQPIRNAWGKLPRVVRDLSNSLGKQVQVKMEGADTELDKTILEALKDPLTHIVRNSVDHGIETAEARVAAGKPAEGTLLLRAFHECGQVNIEIIDDGGGISIDRVRAKAIEKGLVSQADANDLSDHESIQLILLPGFSTAEQVSNVSGRGVGMDVVKTNIERISGSLEIESVPGSGTTLRIKIPLTLAIVPALIVCVEGNQYAIPQVSLLELVRLDRDRVGDEIEYIHNAPVYRLRGNLLPLVYLDQQLEVRSDSPAEKNDAVNIVVLKAEGQQFGLVVDTITDTQEIVVKPLGRYLKNIPIFAGTTIMGDGSVALILDVMGLSKKGNVIGERHNQQLKSDRIEHDSDRHSSHTTLLLVDPGDGSQVAVRLSTVARLEEFKQSQLERSGHMDVVQYRDSIMPLVGVTGGYSPPYEEDSERRIPVVVYSAGERSVGILVGRIIDIVEHSFDDEDQNAMPGRVVVQDRVTELIDLQDVVASNFPEMSQDAYV